MDTSAYNATLIKKEKLSDTLAILSVRPDFNFSEFKSGQFAVLGLLGNAPCAPEAPHCQITPADDLIKRAYSIASSSAQTSFLEFYIAMVPEGTLTPRLFNLKEGDRLFVGKKIVGKFTLDLVPQDKHLLMVATGTGLAPFMSMIRSHLVCGETRQFVIVHGARTSQDLGYYPELSLMSQNCKNFFYIPAISRPELDPNWGGHTGRVPKIILSDEFKKITAIELSPKNFHVLLCGNPEMIHDLDSQLKAKGFENSQIHKEEYW